VTESGRKSALSPSPVLYNVMRVVEEKSISAAPPDHTHFNFELPLLAHIAYTKPGRLGETPGYILERHFLPFLYKRLGIGRGI
jgi:hypothetical protein